MKTQVVHRDILGRELAIGDVVATASSNSLYVMIIDKINPKMVRVKMPNRGWSTLKYSSDLIKIDGPEVTAYLLTKD